jgi:hypothetical protein
MPGHILFASGGDFIGPVVDQYGNIIAHNNPLGGLLGPGTAVLYPNFPSHNVKAGTDKGKIYRRTDWILNLHSVMYWNPGSIGPSIGGDSIGGEWVEVPLTERPLSERIDNTPPRHPDWWQYNPSGIPNPNGRGAALVVYQGSGNYSHTGPWGGWSSLNPDPDRGYFEFGAILPEGTQVTIREEVGGDVAVFTAKLVPVNPGDFAISPQPHVNLANAINAHPVASLYVRAGAGLTWSGVMSTVVESLLPTDETNLVTLATSNAGAIRITGTVPLISGGQLLAGGAKIRQSSLVAGGSLTVPEGAYHPELGMVCEGGVSLPLGPRYERVLYASG